MADREVRFTYDTHAWPMTGLRAQLGYAHTQRMTAISTWLDGAIVREYRLGYEHTGPTKASRLTELTECVDAPPDAGTTLDGGLVCLPATEFGWQVGPTTGPAFDHTRENFGYHIDTVPNSVRIAGVPLNYDSSFEFLDANGDGTTDLAFTQDEVLHLWTTAASQSNPLPGIPSATSVTFDIDLEHSGNRNFVLDWNMDGRDDILRLRPESTIGDDEPEEYSLVAYLSTGSDFVETATNLQIPIALQDGAVTTVAEPGETHGLTDSRRWFQNHQTVMHLADFNGDGHTDYLGCEIEAGTTCDPDLREGRWVAECQHGEWHVAWGEQAPSGDRTFGARQPTGLEFGCGITQNPMFGHAPIGELNGDGLPDVLVVDRDTASYAIVTFDPASNTLVNVPTNLPAPNALFPTLVDANGDGMHDVMTMYVPGGTYGLTYSAEQVYRMGLDSLWLSRLQISEGGGVFRTPEAHPAAGLPHSGWSEANRSVWHRPNYDGDIFHVQMAGFMPIDFNGDGRIDLQHFTVDEPDRLFHELAEPWWGWAPGNEVRYAATPTGAFDVGLKSMTQRSVQYEEVELSGPNLYLPRFEHPTVAGDFDGDGETDVLQYAKEYVLDGDPLEWDPTVDLHINRRSVRERITSVRNGLNDLTQVTYASTSDPDVYTPAHDCEWPQHCDTSPRWVVESVNEHAGTTEARRFEYEYAEGRTDTLGRGWLGFARRVETDLATGAVTTHHFDNVTRHTETGMYPNAGRVVRRVLVLQDDGQGNVSFPDVSSTLLGTVEDTSFLVQRYADGATPPRLRVVELSRAQLKYEEMSAAAIDPHDYDAFANAGLVPRSVTQTSHAYDSMLPFGMRHLPTTSTTTYPDGRQTIAEFETEPPPSGEDSATGFWHVGRVAANRARSLDECASDVSMRAFYDPTTGALERVVRRPDEFAPGRTAAQRHAEWREVEFVHDAYGHIVEASTSDDAGVVRTTTSTYHAADGFAHVQSTSNALGHTTEYYWREFDGTSRGTRDPNGLDYLVSRDGFGRVREQLNPGEPVVEIDYTATLGSSRVDVEQAGQGHAFVLYDPAGRERERRWLTRDETGGSSEARSLTEYDAAGRVRRVSEPSFGPPSRWATVERDAVQVVRRVTGQRSEEVRDYWRTPGTRHARDASGRESYQALDTNGQPEVVRDFGDAEQVVYERCIDGRIVRSHDPDGNVTAVSYDPLGRRLTLDDPDSGLSETEYDAFDQIVSAKDAELRVATFEYDLLGRLERRTTSEGQLDLDYDPAGALGLLRHAKGEDGIETTTAYDALTRPLTRTQEVDGSSYTFEYEYDSNSRLSREVYPTLGSSPIDVQYFYDSSHGGLHQVKSSEGILWDALGGDASGRLTEERFGNGFETLRTYEPGSSLLSKLETTGYIGGGGPLTAVQDWTYTYDADGRLTQQVDAVHGFSETFTYTSEARLHKSDPSTGASLTFGYDSLGNLAYASDVGAIAHAGAQPHAVSQFQGTTQSYDLTGNYLGDGSTRSITYDGRGLPIEIQDWNTGKSVLLRYDAFGNRAASDASDGFRVYFGGYERRGSHEILRVPVGSGVAEISRKIEKTAVEIAYRHHDRRGSTEVVTDHKAQVIMQASYAPFGAERTLPWTLDDPRGFRGVDYGFAGGEEEDEGGLIDLRARQYDPVMRHMTSPDPFITNPGAIGFNRFAYAYNDPINYVDPTGLYPEGVSDAATQADRHAAMATARLYRHFCVNDCTMPDHVVEGVPPGNPVPEPSGAQSIAVRDASGTNAGIALEWQLAGIMRNDVDGAAYAREVHDSVDWIQHRVEVARNRAFAEAGASAATMGASDLVAAAEAFSEMSPEEQQQVYISAAFTLGRLYVSPDAVLTEYSIENAQAFVVSVRTANDETASPEARGTAQAEVILAAVEVVSLAGGIAAVARSGPGRAVRGAFRRAGASGGRPAPQLRSTRAGPRLHGEIPHRGDLRRMSTDDLVELRETTRISLRTRVREMQHLGDRGGHGRRIGQERELLTNVEEVLRNRNL